MIRYVIAGLLTALLFISCSSSQGLKGSDASATLKPKKEIDIDPASMPDNFVVKVRNVADFSHSNKNRFELFVNGKKIRPVNKVHNGTRNYVYRLTLQPGYYDVKGNYFWNGGWKDEKTAAKTKDMVRIEPGERTLLELNLEKDRGVLLDKKLMFTVRRESISGGGQPFTQKTAPVKTYKPAITQSPRTVETKPEVISEPAVTHTPARDIERTPASPARASAKVKLQINTEPDNCDVILDDQMVGQTPLSIWVDPNTSYVVQLKHPNHRTLIRYLDREKLISKDKIILIERLEPVDKSGL